MRTRLLIIFGVVMTTSILFTFLAFEVTRKQNTCEQMGGKWNVDHCLMTQEMLDSNEVRCEPGPVFGDGYCYSNGIKLMFEPKPNFNPESEIPLKTLECYKFFQCDPSKESFEGCISSKRNGVTIEELCKNPDITIEGGCVDLRLDENMTITKCV